MQDTHQEVLVVLIASTLVFFVLTGIIVFALLYSQKRKYLHGQQLVEMEKTYAEALLESKLEIQEETLKTISQEIHDNIGQTLSFVKLNLNTMAEPGSDRDAEKLRQSRDLLTRSIQDLRDLAKVLHTDWVLEGGLNVAVEYQLDLLKKTGQYHTDFCVDGIPYRLDVQRELVVFRVVQELLNNIVKHAEAAWVRVDMNFQPGRLVIQVRDDGKGFDQFAVPEGPEGGKGLGIRNMLNRMTLIGGLITIHTLPGDGTRAIIELP